jgi:peptidoglycan/xylan/chitin deacetylase (PgdA/CDA1 family)
VEVKRSLITGVLLFVASGAFCQSGAAQKPEWGVAVLEVGSDLEARHEQVALRDCLELMGIPFLQTADVQEATRRPLVFIGGILLNTELSAPERETLYAYVEHGGVLLATQVQGNEFFPLFGITRATASRTNFRVQFTSTADPALRYVNRPEERTISLGDPKFYSETVWSTEYTANPESHVLATYENRTAALIVNAYGRGLAYALGLGFKETTLIPRLAQSFEAQRQWINWFEPSGDVFRLLLRGLYEENVHPFLLVHTVPEGKETGLCLSHDVDARESFPNSLVFAKMEAALGVHSTFFVTTKYFLDDTDIGYYTPERVQWIRQVKELGFEVASHSVSHSLRFEQFPVGSADVNPTNYDPSHPTLFGEVSVSKQMLDRDLQQQTAGFRSGYLIYPSELLGVLETSGYSFDSSVSAQWVLTNYPYFGFRKRSLDSEHSQIVVVPVALDDSRGELAIREFLTSETEQEALRIWTDVIRANAENNAITCLLIHPTNITYKLETERRLIEANRGSETWIGDVGTVARFWRGRAQLRPSLGKGSDGREAITLNLKQADLPSGQTLVIEATHGAAVPQVLDVSGHPIPMRTRVTKDRVFLLLP